MSDLLLATMASSTSRNGLNIRRAHSLVTSYLFKGIMRLSMKRVDSRRGILDENSVLVLHWLFVPVVNRYEVLPREFLAMLTRKSFWNGIIS